MARGSEGKLENWQVYFAWRQGKTLNDLTAYIQRRKDGDVYRYSLGRRKIDNELKIGAAINQNPDIRNELLLLESKMRDAGLMPPDEPILSETDDGDENDPAQLIVNTPAQGGFSASDKRRLNELEEENAYLREELKEKNASLKKYGLIDHFLTDTMRMPR
jgi:hypothetical protein